MTDDATGKDANPAAQDAEESGKDAAVDAAGAETVTPPSPDTLSGDAAESRPSARIQIGSRRSSTTSASQAAPESTESAESTADSAEATAAEVTPQTAAATAAPQSGPIPTPSVRDALPADLEAEIADALGDASLDQLINETSPAPGSDELEANSRRQAVVIRTDGEHVFVSLGAANEGMLPVRQLAEPPQPNDQLEVVVKKFNMDDGLYEVAMPGAAIEVEDWSDLEQGVVVEARITGANTGGLECMVNQIRGFIPASQIGVFRVEDFAQYIGQKLSCVVNEVNRRKKNLVLSHRAVLERESQAKRKETLEAIKVGTTVEGTVRSVRDFGAFVDIGGIDGLVHVSQLSWERVNHPSEVVKEGDKVKVKIEKVDKQSGKISLSCRALEEHPWTNIASRFQAGEVVTGTVTRVATFGAFVRLAPAVEGLVHVSELAYHHVSQVESVVKQGDEVEVKILGVDPEAQRISLSIKQLQEAPQRDDSSSSDEADDEPLRESVVKPTNKPLKGGTNKSTGGEQFGLKW